MEFKSSSANPTSPAPSGQNIPEKVQGIDEIISLEGLRPGMTIRVTSLPPDLQDFHTQSVSTGRNLPTAATPSVLRALHPAIILDVQKDQYITVVPVKTFAGATTLEGAGIAEDSRACWIPIQPATREAGGLWGPLGVLERDPSASIDYPARWVYVRRQYTIRVGTVLKAPKTATGPLRDVYSEESLDIIRAALEYFRSPGRDGTTIDVKSYLEELAEAKPRNGARGGA